MFQGDTLMLCDYIHVFVFTTNHHLYYLRVHRIRSGTSLLAPYDVMTF